MNKTLFKSIREYKKQSMLAPILVILEVLMEVLIPLEMAKIIDVGIANGDLGWIFRQYVSALSAADASHISRIPQAGHQLFQIMFRNLLPLGHAAQSHRSGSVVLGDIDHRSHAIATLG